jgi:hypothetical protein
LNNVIPPIADRETAGKDRVQYDCWAGEKTIRRGADRRNRRPDRKRNFVPQYGIIRAITRAVIIPKMTSGRKYNVHKRGFTPRTF